MKHDPDRLRQLVARTLDHYQARAEAFWQGTRDHDVSQNIDALLRHVRACRLLPSSTSAAVRVAISFHFAQRGHHAIGLEGAPALAAMARAHGAGEVWEQDFLELDLPVAHFDGVFANASLFHVPRQELPRVLRQLHATLKTGGVLFSSNPRGDNQESLSGERYGAYYDLATWRDYLLAAGFAELEHYYRPPGLPFEQQPVAGERVAESGASLIFRFALAFPRHSPNPNWVNCVLLLLLLPILAPAATAAPRKPIDDAEVLERLPSRAGDAGARELAAMRAAMTAAAGNPAPAAALAQRYFDLAMARGDPRYVGYAEAVVARFAGTLAGVPAPDSRPDAAVSA